MVRPAAPMPAPVGFAHSPDLSDYDQGHARSTNGLSKPIVTQLRGLEVGIRYDLPILEVFSERDGKLLGYGGSGALIGDVYRATPVVAL
jgi:hypothetical protein